MEGRLGALDPAARAAFEALGTRRRYAAGATLFLEGDLGASVMLIRSGHVKIVVTTDDGRDAVLAVRGPGELLGDLSAIDGRPRSASGVALDPLDAQIVAADEFRRFLAETPGAGLALLQVVVARMRDSDRLRVELGARDTYGRVALRLVELAETAGDESTERGEVRIALPITQDDLAGWVAASREAVARALASMRRRGLVRTGRREITVTDLDGLRAASR